jgi:hypothetical protein
MQKPKLLDEARIVARLKHLSRSTETAYVSFIRRFILFHHKRHPLEMGAEEIRAFLSHLAIEQRVADSTRCRSQSPCRSSLMKMKSQKRSEPEKTGILIFESLPSRMIVPMTENSVRARRYVQSSTQMARLSVSARTV